MHRSQPARSSLPFVLALTVVACADRAADAGEPSAQELYDGGAMLERRRRGQEDIRAALSLYERAVQADSTFLLGHAGLARTHAGMIHFMYQPTPEHKASARAAAETALRLGPDDAEAHHAMGVYWYWAEKDYTQAAAEFEAASRLAPDNAEIQAMTGYVQRRRGEWEQALMYLERAAFLDRGSPSIRVDLADTYEAFGRTEAAIATWREVEALEGGGHFDVNRGMVMLRATGSPDSVRAALERVPAGFDPDGNITVARYDLAWGMGSPDEVIRVLDASRQSFLDNQNFRLPRSILAARAHRLAGRAAAARAAYDTARTVLETELAAAPEDACLRVAYGSALAGLGRPEDAVREAGRALELMPASRDAMISQSIRRQAAAVLADAGQAAEAVQMLTALFEEPVFGYTRRQLGDDPTWERLRSRPDFRRLQQP